MKLNDRDVVIVEFLHDRLLEVYKENENLDYMHKARETASKIRKIVSDDDARTETALPIQSVSGWAYIRKHLKPILIGFAIGITLMNLFSLIENIVLKIALIVNGG